MKTSNVIFKDEYIRECIGRCTACAYYGLSLFNKFCPNCGEKLERVELDSNGRKTILVRQ